MNRVFVTAEFLHSSLKQGAFRIFDCTFVGSPKPDPVKFRSENYGNFVELQKAPSEAQQKFLQAHIPTSVHFDLNVALFPGQFERFSLYEAEVFQKYPRLLGLNKDDAVVVYGRGPGGGMLFASRVYWMLKSYGHERVFILNGGFDAWTKAGYETASADHIPSVVEGDWEAKDCSTGFVKFEELKAQGAFAGHQEEFVMLDARPRPQFTDKAKADFGPKVPGSRLPGSRNLPALDLVNADGLIKDEDAVKEMGKAVELDSVKSAVTFCNGANQGALLAAVLNEVYPELPLRVYNGSLFEVVEREPTLISE